MTEKKGKEVAQRFIDACQEQGDPFLIVHFSPDSDRFWGKDNGMDMADVLIVIKQLVKKHDINPQVLAGMFETQN